MRKKYFKIFGFYIHKKVVCTLFCLLLICGFLLFHKHTFAMLDFITNRSEYSVYTKGDFRLAKYKGKIKLLDENGVLLYVGEYQQGKYNGAGTLYRDGVKYYQGQFEANEMNDEKGVLYYESGEIKYQGEVVNGKMKGNGKRYYRSGVLQSNGQFSEDQEMGFAITYDEKGKVVYEGDFKEGQFHGQGTLFNKNGSIRYEGAFIAGKMHGKGTLYSTIGKLLYEGEMINDHINYESLYHVSLKAILGYFKVTPRILQYKAWTAFIYEDVNAMFITSDPVYFAEKEVKKEADKMQKSTLLEMDQQIDPGAVIFEEVMLIKQVWHNPHYSHLSHKKLTEYLTAYGYGTQSQEKMDYHHAFAHFYLNQNQKQYTDFTASKQSDFINTIVSYEKAKEFSIYIMVHNEYRVKYVFEKDVLLYSLVYGTSSGKGVK